MRFIWSLPCVLLFAGSAFSEGHNTKLNSHMAACAALGNQEEIAVSQFGVERAQNPKVKQFAERMVQDHSAFLAKLEAHAPKEAMQKLDARVAASRTDRAADRKDQPKATPTGRDADRAAKKDASGDKMLLIAREVTQECTNLAIQELESKDAGKFDQCFIGWQIGAHMGMLAKLRTYERHAEGELKQLFAEGVQKTQEYLDMAKGIEKELASASKPTTERRAAN